jgi:hypothetical protein
MDYLWNRIPGMTKEAAFIIIETLMAAQHIDPKTKLLIVDPTKSNWRELLQATNKNYKKGIPESLSSVLVENQQQEQRPTLKNADKNQLLWETFDLAPGRSPLAKALHRAWAFHEYCSESVIPAMTFFQTAKKV